MGNRRDKNVCKSSQIDEETGIDHENNTRRLNSRQRNERRTSRREANEHNFAIYQGLQSAGNNNMVQPVESSMLSTTPAQEEERQRALPTTQQIYSHSQHDQSFTNNVDNHDNQSNQDNGVAKLFPIHDIGVREHEFTGIGLDGRIVTPWYSWWPLTYSILTCCFPSCLLSCCGGMKDRRIQRAWREKVALCSIIIGLCLALGFMTFGLSLFVCRPPKTPLYRLRMIQKASVTPTSRWFMIRGKIYNVPEKYRPYRHKAANFDPYKMFFNQDISIYFPIRSKACLEAGVAPKPLNCRLPGTRLEHCHGPGLMKDLEPIADVAFDWEDIYKHKRTVVNGEVYDLSVYLDQFPTGVDKGGSKFGNLVYPFGRRVDLALRRSVGRDGTKALLKFSPAMRTCLRDQLRIGFLEVKTFGCIVTDVILYVSLVCILGLVVAKFVLAVTFSFLMGKRLGKPTEGPSNLTKPPKDHYESGWSRNLKPVRYANAMRRNTTVSSARDRSGSGLFKSDSNGTFSDIGIIKGSNEAMYASTEGMINNANQALNIASKLDSTNSSTHFYNIILVTCYSEGEEGLRTTLDSLVTTEYDERQMLTVIISDGIVRGSENALSTPDILVGMLELVHDRYEGFHFDQDGRPEAYSYVSIADGEKRYNRARVYAGYYRSVLSQESINKKSKGKKGKDKKKNKKNKKKGEDEYSEEQDYEFEGDLLSARAIPVILIVKVGGVRETTQTVSKPGNRGKRDSQIILMNFLSKCLFDDRMTPLEYDIFFKIYRLTGILPDHYEAVLMVDADTKVAPTALNKLVQVLKGDPLVMGLCGETRIANKTASWVSMIQVFEYYISHHSSKAFESIFGGVTCLPGCFCLYRIKAPKGPNCWVPILASPDIIDAYAENITDTLHRKNLLLLGEDRYLTTLMLKTFTKRKLLFVPQAICKTIVPDSFRVLLSQRRRWINSTVHNLFELVLVPDLCGTFCCSMQFVVFMELVGTLVLPAAICFTGVLITSTFLTEPQWIPLFLLAAVLGLPALLILFTTLNLLYIFWFLVYIIALPIWNFVLPVYAFWHFDDFSWGETRKVAGSTPKQDRSGHDDGGGGHDGKMDESENRIEDPSISMRRWHEFEQERLEKTNQWLAAGGGYGDNRIKPMVDPILHARIQEEEQRAREEFEYAEALRLAQEKLWAQEMGNYEFGEDDYQEVDLNYDENDDRHKEWVYKHEANKEDQESYPRNHVANNDYHIDNIKGNSRRLQTNSGMRSVQMSRVTSPNSDKAFAIAQSAKAADFDFEQNFMPPSRRLPEVIDEEEGNGEKKRSILRRIFRKR